MFELSHLNEYETTPKDKRNATLVLKTWGIGVQSQRALGYFDRDKGEMVETQSFYLVEEEPLVKPANKGKADKAA